MDSTNPTPGAAPNPVSGTVVTHERRSPQVLTGVLLIVLGGIFLIDRMGWQWDMPWGLHLTFRHLWPLLLIFAGIATAFTDREATVTTTYDAAGRPQTVVAPAGRRHYGDGLFLTMVGVLMLLHVNAIFSLRQSWPLFIVAGGLSMIFGKSRRDGRRRRLREEGR